MYIKPPINWYKNNPRCHIFVTLLTQTARHSSTTSSRPLSLWSRICSILKYNNRIGRVGQRYCSDVRRTAVTQQRNTATAGPSHLVTVKADVGAFFEGPFRKRRTLVSKDPELRHSQWWTRMEWDSIWQPFGCWTVGSTSWTTVALNFIKCQCATKHQRGASAETSGCG